MTSSIITTFAGTGNAGFNGDGLDALKTNLSIDGIAVDISAGNVYLADTYNHLIRMVNVTSNTVHIIAGTGSGSYSGDGGPATAASLYEPIDVSLDAAGNVYIAVKLDHRIRMVNITTGDITTIAGNGVEPVQAYNIESNKNIGDGGAATSAMLFFPNGVVVDSNGTHLLLLSQPPSYSSLISLGDVYMCDESNRVRRITMSTGIIETVVGQSYYRFDETYGGDGGSPTSADLHTPADLAFDAAGTAPILSLTIIL
jgi:hypothetical protein